MFEEDYFFELAFIKCSKCIEYTECLKCKVYLKGIPRPILGGTECDKFKEKCNDNV
jgi:hypothetical protein